MREQQDCQFVQNLQAYCQIDQIWSQMRLEWDAPNPKTHTLLLHLDFLAKSVNSKLISFHGEQGSTWMILKLSTMTIHVMLDQLFYKRCVSMLCQSSKLISINEEYSSSWKILYLSKTTIHVLLVLLFYKRCASMPQ